MPLHLDDADVLEARRLALEKAMELCGKNNSPEAVTVAAVTFETWLLRDMQEHEAR